MIDIRRISLLNEKNAIETGAVTFRFEPRSEKNRSSGFPTWSDTNRAVQSEKMARGLKFCI